MLVAKYGADRIKFFPLIVEEEGKLYAPHTVLKRVLFREYTEMLEILKGNTVSTVEDGEYGNTSETDTRYCITAEKSTRSLILVSADRVRGRIVGEVVKRVEQRGLEIRALNMVWDCVEKFFPSQFAVALCVEGLNCASICRDALSEYLSPAAVYVSPEGLAEADLLHVFPNESWDYRTSIVSVGNQSMKVTLPYCEYITPAKKLQRPIPLGIVKTLIESNFEF